MVLQNPDKIPPAIPSGPTARLVTSSDAPVACRADLLNDDDDDDDDDDEDDLLRLVEIWKISRFR